MKILVRIPVGESMREAIPIRAIQFALRWRHATAVARELAHIGDKDWPHGPPVLARHWDDQSEIGEVPAYYWKDLSAPRVTKPGKTPSPIDEARWLPAGVFLWRDDFERAFNHVLTGYPTPGLKLGPGGFAFLFDPEPGDVPREVIMQGFEELAPIAFDATISLHQASVHLRNRLGANDFEIQRWILGGWIQAYRHHRLRDDNSCSKAEPWRFDPDRGGPEIDARGEPQIYLNRRFLREDVERFDPSAPSADELEPKNYPEFGLAGVFDSDDPRIHGFNPSGRFVSFRQTVAFLSAFADADDVVKQLRFEVAEDSISAYGLATNAPLLEDGYFSEAQILGWATIFFGRPFDGWDAITQQRLPGPDTATPPPAFPPLTVDPAPGEPDPAPKPKKRLNRAQSSLLKILDELECYATEADVPFGRRAMPGPVGDGYENEGSFHWLCAKLDPVFRKAKATFEKHRSGLCATQKYAQQSNFYREALPHIAPIFTRKKSARQTNNRNHINGLT